MTNLFSQGGPIFMSILTLILFGCIVSIIMTLKDMSYKPYIKQLGLLAFVVGILSQFIGLFQMLSVLEEIGQVSAPLLAGGLKVSLIAPIYGVIIFGLSLIASNIIKLKVPTE